MNEHFAGIRRQVAPGVPADVTLDDPGWHQPGGKLRLPDTIGRLPPSPYPPELNPVEKVWRFLRQNYFGNRVCVTDVAIFKACRDAWTHA